MKRSPRTLWLHSEQEAARYKRPKRGWPRAMGEENGQETERERERLEEKERGEERERHGSEDPPLQRRKARGRTEVLPLHNAYITPSQSLQKDTARAQAEAYATNGNTKRADCPSALLRVKVLPLHKRIRRGGAARWCVEVGAIRGHNGARKRDEVPGGHALSK